MLNLFRLCIAYTLLTFERQTLRLALWMLSLQTRRMVWTRKRSMMVVMLLRCSMNMMTVREKIGPR